VTERAGALALKLRDGDWKVLAMLDGQDGATHVLRSRQDGRVFAVRRFPKKQMPTIGFYFHPAAPLTVEVGEIPFVSGDTPRHETLRDLALALLAHDEPCHA
jgi:hypothetical protein